LNALFTPISGFLTFAQHIPGAGTIATGINNIFSAIGTASADTAVQEVNALPISQGTKDTIIPIARELSALAAQIVAGEGGGEAFHTIADRAKTLLSHVAEDPVMKGEAVAPAPEVPKAEASSFTPISSEQAAPEALYHGSTSGKLSTDENGNINFGTNEADIAQFGKPITVTLDGLKVKDFATKAEMFDAASTGKAQHIADGYDVVRAENHAIGINPEKISKTTGTPIAEDFLNKPIDVKATGEQTPSKIGKSVEQSALAHSSITQLPYCDCRQRSLSSMSHFQLALPSRRNSVQSRGANLVRSFAISSYRWRCSVVWFASATCDT
jgi:hypothetical protein